MYPIDKLSTSSRYMVKEFFNYYQGDGSMECDPVYFLRYWNKNKVRLFKLFNNNLDIKFPIDTSQIENDKHCLVSAFDFAYKHVVLLNHRDYQYMIIAAKKNQAMCRMRDELPHKMAYRIYHVAEYNQYAPVLEFLFLVNNEMDSDIVCNIGAGKLIKWPKKFEELTNKKITRGMKYPKAIKHLMELIDFHDDYLYTNWLHRYSDMRTTFCSDYSNTQLVLSIHPLDYLGMSHGEDWSTCMSWKTKGCYRAGTIEMMNSNNCIIAYLTNGKLDNLHRPNKLWRCLIFIDKDIIVSDKSYPFGSDVFKKLAITKTKELIEQHWHWKYQFGPQLYHDMKICGCNDNVHHRYDDYDDVEDIAYCRPLKQNGIYMHMGGFYNDFAEDPGENYWCYRNKVEKTKIIGCSGQFVCTCCGKKIDVSPYSYDDTENHPAHGNIALCNECQLIHLCYSCDEWVLSNKLYQFKEVSVTRFFDGIDIGGNRRFVLRAALYPAQVICSNCLAVDFDVNAKYIGIYEKNTEKFIEEVDLNTILRYNNQDILLIRYPKDYDVIGYIKDWIANGEIKSDTCIRRTIRP